MIIKITKKEKVAAFIKLHPSYTKKSVRFLAKRFKSSEKLIKEVLVILAEDIKNYRLKKVI